MAMNELFDYYEIRILVIRKGVLTHALSISPILTLPLLMSIGHLFIVISILFYRLKLRAVIDTLVYCDFE